MDMGQEILENPEITKAELLDKLTDLEDYIKCLQILGNPNIERRVLEKFVTFLSDSRRPALANIANTILQNNRYSIK